MLLISTVLVSVFILSVFTRVSDKVNKFSVFNAVNFHTYFIHIHSHSRCFFRVSYMPQGMVNGLRIFHILS